jgi:hypothetical protein
MLMHQVKIGLSSLALLVICVASCAAQSNSAAAEAAPAVECGGQYECIEPRPLTPAEARTSLGYPQGADSQDPRVATRVPMPNGPDADGKPDATSTP